MARVLPLMLLLALALFLAPSAAAFRFRPRRGRREQVSVSSNMQIDSNDANTTTTGGDEGPASNTTLPKECEAVSDKCIDNLGSLAETNHNDTLAETDKDTTLQDFCATDCGKNYTDHVTAVLQGKCVESFPSRVNASGGPDVGVVVRAPPGVVVVVGQHGGPGRDHVHRVYGEEYNENDDDDDDDNDDDDDDDDNNNGQATSSSSGNEDRKKPNNEQEMLDAFHKDHPGTALGCVADPDGVLCAGKQGCDFFNSCCYSSWSRLGDYAGYPISARTVRAVEYFCPGSYLNIDGCT